MKQQQGFTLLEVLIAGLVIIVGLLGVVNLQLSSQKRSFEAHQSTLAGLYAQDLQARLNTDTCYLSKKNEELSEFIGNYPSNGTLHNFLEKHKNEWRTEHFKGSRSSWNSTLTAELVLGNTSDQANEIKNDGYWQFKLTIIPPGANSDTVEQRLIVQYKKDGCD